MGNALKVPLQKFPLRGEAKMPYKMLRGRPREGFSKSRVGAKLQVPALSLMLARQQEQWGGG